MSKKHKKSFEEEVEFTNNPFSEISSELGFSSKPAVSGSKKEPEIKKGKSHGLPCDKIEKIVLQSSRKGRGGKTVTYVNIWPSFDEKSLSSFCKELKKGLGCGAWVENGGIVLQGDVKEKASHFLEKKGVKNIIYGN